MVVTTVHPGKKSKARDGDHNGKRYRRGASVDGVVWPRGKWAVADDEVRRMDKKARYQSNVYAKTEFSEYVILSLPMCQTRVCGDPPRTLCTPVGVASEGQRMSRVGLNSSQGKHLTLNFTVVVRGSKWGDRECG